MLLPSTRLDYCHNGNLYKKQPKNTGLGEERPLTNLDQLQKMQKIAKNTGPGGRTPFDQSASTVRNAKNLQKTDKRHRLGDLPRVLIL